MMMMSAGVGRTRRKKDFSRGGHSHFCVLTLGKQYHSRHHQNLWWSSSFFSREGINLFAGQFHFDPFHSDYYQSSVVFSIVQGGRNGSSSHIFDFVVSLSSSWMRVHVERKSVRGQLAHHFDHLHHHHRHHIMIDPF